MVIELDDSEFDITINEENKPEVNSDANITNLLLSFFTNLATRIGKITSYQSETAALSPERKRAGRMKIQVLWIF